MKPWESFPWVEGKPLDPRKEETERRNRRVLEVLTDTPTSPTVIAQMISEPWTLYPGSVPMGKSNAITPILRRVGAVRHPGGKWTKPGGSR